MLKCLVYVVLKIKPRVSYVLEMCSPNGATSQAYDIAIS